MGQQLFKNHLEVFDTIVINDNSFEYNTILSDNDSEDINFFNETESDIFSSERLFLKRIQNQLTILLTKPCVIEEINIQINNILTEKVFNSIENCYKEATQQITKIYENQQRLETIFSNKSKENDRPFSNEQFSYFAIQSLLSVLLILIKSAEKNDPLIIQQILSLASQLCEQMPMNCLSSSNTNFLFKSLIDYFNELSLLNDLNISKQALKILLSFSIVKTSFKDILPLLNRLILDTTEIHNVQGLFIQLNNGLTEIVSIDENNLSLNHLKSIEAYPNSQLIKLNTNLFTGQFISLIILLHIDIHSDKQLTNDSFSFEFHPDTFKYLFNMIEKLSTTITDHANILTLVICLKLFTKHLKFLCAIKSDLDRDIPSRKFVSNFSLFVNNDELIKWFELLLKLTCDKNEKLERIMICEESSKALVYIVNQRTTSFLDKLVFMHQYIIENQYPILIKEFFIELNKKEILLRWIEILCIEPTAMKILYSFTDMYFNPSTEEQKQQIENILLVFQQLLLYRLTSLTSSVVSEYITYIFKKSVEIENELFYSILIGLCSMTKTNEIFDFIAIQPIFATTLPLLADYLLEYTITDDSSNNRLDFISWLIGKMCHVMLVGSSVDSLEMKYSNKLKSAIFIGGCEKQTIENSQYLSHLYNSNLANYSQFSVLEESSSDKEFLLSIYNNTGDGARLISKMKTKHYLIQKSIEQQTNELSACVFAVYIKHYRRINLAKYELTRTTEAKPSNELLSIFEYANQVQTIFATTKAQGGDYDELYQQIKTNALFLLLSIKESDLIPIIEEDLYRMTPEISEKKKFTYERQNSRWTKAKYVIRLLRNVMKACIRFKRLRLRKTQLNNQKYDDENNLKQTIDTFLYGKFYKVSIGIIDEVKDMKLEEINICLSRQYERAMTRLITYRYFQGFIEKICNLEDFNQVIRILNYCLPYLRSTNLEWSYLENTSSVNNQLKEEIRKIYYSIIKMILSTSNQSKILFQNIFHLLNLSYESNDIHHIYNHQFAVTFFTLSDYAEIDFRFITFYWFRLFAVKLSKYIRLNILKDCSLHRQSEIVFNTLILNELKKFKHTLSIDTDDSLKYISIDSFVRTFEEIIPTDSNHLYINQYLTLLLRCIYYCESIRSICATVDYIEELLYIYHHSKCNSSVILSVKILHKLIPYLPETADEKSKILMENFLIEILFSIGESFISQQIKPEIVTELIYIYRTLVCVNSAWQTMAIQLLFNSITFHLNLKSIEINDQNQINPLLASLGVLGGYIQPFCLSANVKVTSDNEQQLAIIIEIDKNMPAKPYFIQYVQINHTKWVSADQLKLEIDVQPPNLLLLPDANTFIHPILDALGHFIQIDTSTTESLLLLQLKRRCISALYHLINTQELIEIFIQKPYASIIPTIESLSKTFKQPSDLHLFSKQHLEQYSLSLDTCERSKQIVEDNENLLNNNNTNKQLIIDTLSTHLWKYNGWKPYAIKSDIQLFKRGRIGSNEISIVPMPSTAADMKVIQECGDQHRFKGRVNLSSDGVHVNLPTFIAKDLQVSEGKWYFCVRVPNAGLQIGWATNGFIPRGNSGVALGDDRYSWSYDGTRDILLNNGVYPNRFGEKNCWKLNDVCGCGIDIDGENINIKYWLNGKFLGTAFRHQTNIGSSGTECDLMPNEQSPIYFPGVSLQFDNYPNAFCEFIFSPEDMQECPLPNSYRPLLLPKLIHIENSLVAYPYNAYLIGDNIQDYFYSKRTRPSTTMLRDFINENHLEIDFNLEDNQLILPEDSLGFPLSIDNDATSYTISFDFQILSTADKLNIQLFTSDIMDALSIHIPSTKIRVVIVLHLNEQQTEVYLNTDYQIFKTQFQINSQPKFNFYLLPKIHAGITNIAIWKYDLSKEHIHRLFTLGLFYISIDYQHMKEYGKRVNTFTFQNNEFSSELLIPFDEPFTENIWEKKKKQVDNDESKYFKSNDQSSITLFGNKTYLVLEKSDETWLEYTLILDISIPNYPNINEDITLVTLNNTSQVCINYGGQLYLTHNEIAIESHSKITLNEYFRLWIYIRDQHVKIYVNEKLEIESISNDQDQYDQCHATLNQFKLFRETNNTTDENTLRIQCRSITFRNRSIEQQSNCSLESIVTPTWSIIASSLIAIGYKKEWILSAMKRYNTINIQNIDTIIREHRQEFLEEEFENERNCFLKILSRLNFNIDQDIINTSKIDVEILSQFILNNSKSEEYKEISKENITEWIRDHSSEYDVIYKLYDLSQEQTASSIQNHKSIQYSHQNISQKQILISRIASEHGLTMIYARHIILNVLKIWSDQSTILVPLEKFGDYTFLVPLVRLMDYYNTRTDENIDQISLLIKSILQGEIKQNKTPFLFQLQKDIITQIIHILLNKYSDDDDDVILHEQEILKQPNINFIFKVFNLFIELITNMEILISLFFPASIINLIFDLFLVVSTDQSRFFLLQLFSKLMQKSEQFRLSQSIQYFLTNLLVQCSSDLTSINNRLSKNLETVLMEVIFLISSRQEMNLTELSQSIRNIFILIDVIKLLTGQTVSVEAFFAQSQDVLGEGNGLTQEAFEKSKIYFDVHADQQLINLMNNDELLTHSFSDFIDSLPTESAADSQFYANYPLLSNIQVDYIQIRAKFIYQLNQLVFNILPLVDFNLLPGESYLIDKIRTVKMYLLYSTKLQLLNETFEKTHSGYNEQWINLDFDTVKASIIDGNSENTMFYQAYEQLHTDAHDSFRRLDHQIWHSQYLGMHSTDQGGPYRDSISRICSDICSSRLSLFILCPNGRTNMGLNRDCWIPNVFPPNKPIPNHFKKQYRFIGQLMGMAIRRKHYLDLKFPLLLWKQLLQEEITIEDIQDIDIQSFTIINEIEKNIEQTKTINADHQDVNYVFNSIMSELRFDVVSSASQTYELIPNGMNIPITAANFQQYCTSYRQYRLNEFRRQIEFIRQGLFNIVPCYYLSLFTANELEEAVCGKGQIDVEFLKKNTVYDANYNQNSPIIQRFWKVFDEMFTNEQKKAFLIFVWGRNTLPRQDEDFDYNFTISAYSTDDDDVVDRLLPRAHTCTFTIELPEYSTEEIMYERLNYAITHCSSIDGDGTMNEISTGLDHDYDTTSDEDE